MSNLLVKPYWIHVGPGAWNVAATDILSAFKQPMTSGAPLDELKAANQANPRWREGLWLIPGGWPEPKDGPAWEHMVPFTPSPTTCDAGKAERKPYRYRVQTGERPWTIAQKFGRPYGDWVRLRQANYDDPGGFSRPASDCGVCGFAEWNPGKFVWIPAEWPDPPKQSPLWKLIESAYPTSTDAGQIGAPDGEHNMIRHTIQRGETSGTIARAYGVSKAAVLDANPQLAKGFLMGERDFVKEHFKVQGVINVPVSGNVGAPPAQTGQVGCGGGCGSANPWRAPAQQRQSGNVGCGGAGGCGCGDCRPMGPAPMCLPTDGQWNPSFPWSGFPQQTQGAGGWNPSFPWGASMGVSHLTQPPPYAGPGCGTCGAPFSGQIGAPVDCGSGVTANENVRYVVPSGYMPGQVAVDFGFDPNSGDGSAGKLRGANLPWQAGCTKTPQNVTVLAGWKDGLKLKIPAEWFGDWEDHWDPKVFTSLFTKDPATGTWTVPYKRGATTTTCAAGTTSTLLGCVPNAYLPVGGACPAGTLNVGGYCIPPTGHLPIPGLPAPGCLPGTSLQNGVCTINPGGGAVPGVLPGTNGCAAGMTLYSDGLCYPTGSQPTGLTPVAYGDTAKKDEGFPMWGYAAIGVGLAGAVVLAISASKKSKVTTTRTTVPAHGGAGEVVLVDERGAAHGRRLPAARKSTSRRSR